MFHFEAYSLLGKVSGTETSDTIAFRQAAAASATYDYE